MSGRRNRPLARLAGALAGAGLLAAAGCGERTFDAESLAAELQAAGAVIVLGEQLPVSTEGIEVRAISIARLGDAGRPSRGLGDGALVVLEDSDAAREEFARCETALDFTCYRAANTVLRFTGMSPVEQDLMSQSVSALAGED